MQPESAPEAAKRALAALVTDATGSHESPYSHEALAVARSAWYGRLTPAQQATAEGLDADLLVNPRTGVVEMQTRDYYISNVGKFIIYSRHRHHDETAPATLDRLLSYLRDCLFFFRVETGTRARKGGPINHGSYNKHASALLWYRVRGLWGLPGRMPACWGCELLGVRDRASHTPSIQPHLLLPCDSNCRWS